MAKVHGTPGAEKALIDICKFYIPDIQVDSFEDVNIAEELVGEECMMIRRQFERQRPKMEKEITYRISGLQEQLYDLLAKRDQGKDIRKDYRRIQREISGLNDHLENPDLLFQQYSDAGHRDEDAQMIHFTIEYKGAEGEANALKVLRRLDNLHHVLCDVNLAFNRGECYFTNKPVLTQQVDFVLVGPTGVYSIEIKNPSDDQFGVYDKDGWNCYTQSLREKCAVEHVLRRSGIAEEVIPVIASRYGSIPVNPAHPSVLAISSGDLKHLPSEQNHHLDQASIESIVESLLPFLGPRSVAKVRD